MNTCDTCKNWSTDAESWKGSQFYEKYKEQGECSLFGDINQFNDAPPRNDVCYGWDYEGYSAGVTVMAKFGCIHWQKKED
jgi:hypothetical protein